MEKPVKTYKWKSIDTNDNKADDTCAEYEDDTITLEMERLSKDTNHANHKGQPIADVDVDFPKDKGWAWFVMIGALLAMTLLIGILKAGGIIFVAFQERFNSTSSLTSLLSTLHNAVYSLSAPIVLCVGKQVASARTLLFIGSFILSAAFIITSQAHDIRILFFSHGILQGIGTAFMLPISTVILASYFEKKRGFANSMALSGGSLGGLIFAPLLVYLLKEYGYQGCFLIIAAILLHGCVCGALFRPLSFYKKRAKTRTPKVIDPNCIEGKALIASMPNRPSGISKASSEGERRTHNGNLVHDGKPDIPRVNTLTPNKVVDVNWERIDDNQNDMLKEKSVGTLEGGQSTTKHLDNSETNLYGSMEYFCGSMVDMNLEPFKEYDVGVDNTNNSNETKTETKPKMTVKAMLKILISSFDFNLFKNPIFCIFQIAGFITCGNILLLPVYIAPHARDMGLQANDIALIVTVLSSTDFISRISVAVIADRGWIRRSNISAISVFVVAVVSNFLQFYATFNVLLVYSVVLGMFSGVYFSLYAVLIVDYLTIHKMQATLGFMALFHGASVSVFYYVVGYLRDVTGSYIIPFHLMGCLCLLGSVFLFSLPFVERYQQRKECKTV